MGEKKRRVSFNRSAHEREHAGQLPPSGSLVMYAGASDNLPNGWLLCDGSAVSRGTYSRLFNVIGELYGAGDGTTTFNLPDFRDAHPAGIGTTVAAGLVAGGSHNNVGSHTHDGHGTAVADHTVKAASQGSSAGSVVTTGGHTGTHSSDGTHTHNSHTYATGAVPPYTGVNFIIKI